MPQYMLESDAMRGYSVCSYANRYVFVSGGGNFSAKRNKASNKVFRIDLATDKW